jgi:rubrerythrin
MGYRVKKKLNYLIKDEKKAPEEYRKFKHLLKSKQDKKIVSGIIKDEQRHFKTLRKMKSKFDVMREERRKGYVY